MPRKKSPEGKRVPMSARFSESDAAAIDEARGHEERGVWIRRAVLAAVERQRPPEGATDRAAQAVAENLAAARGDCPHPKARVLKGLCGACGTNVGKP
jgi:hypothetical protein